MSPRHIPVLLDEVISLLNPQSGQDFIDCTVGGGGHAEAILKRTAPSGKLLAIDLDDDALAAARQQLSPYSQRVIFVHDTFAKLKQIHNEHSQLHKVNGILLDLGLSSLELEDERRGFSFQIEAPLDMRFDRRQPLTAADIVNTWPFDKLQKVIQEYGQERLAREVTKQIINTRQKEKITKTKQLVEAILLAFRNKLKTKREVPWIGGLHPATRTFQALRLAVNDELGSLQNVLPQCLDVLSSGGRLAVISFHSLEDKIVKDFFRAASRSFSPDEAAAERDVEHRARLKIITKKPVTASRAERERNLRSRSAKLRVAEKI